MAGRLLKDRDPRLDDLKLPAHPMKYEEKYHISKRTSVGLFVHFSDILGLPEEDVTSC